MVCFATLGAGSRKGEPNMNHSSVKKPKRREALDGEKGNSLVMLVIAIFAIIGIAGLVLDYSSAVWARAQMQKGADSAALAGARYLPSADQGLSKSLVMLDQNYPDYTDETRTPGTNQFEVTVSDNIPTYFMRLFDKPNIPVSVYARAVTGVNVCGLPGSFPFAVVNPNLNDCPADDLVPANYWKRYIIGYGEPNISVPNWANACDPSWTPSYWGSAKGWRNALRLNNDCTYDPGVGPPDLAPAILDGWCGEMGVGDIVPTVDGAQTNSMMILKAREERLARSTLTLETLKQAYIDGTQNQYFPDSRIILVPIVSMLKDGTSEKFTVQDFNNGLHWDLNHVIIDGFAPFWLLSKQEQGDVSPNPGPDWDYVTGYFLPPIGINNYEPCAPGTGTEFGVYATARLAE